MKTKIKNILKRSGLYLSPSEKKLMHLEKEFKSMNIVSNGKKVLFTHSFSIYEPSFIHDKLFAFALRLRGFELASTFCDGVQNVECNVYGGVWGGGNAFKKNCDNCQNKSNQLWSFLAPENIYKYSTYLNQKDYEAVTCKLEQVAFDEWSSYCEDDWNVGLWAKDVLVNNYVVADYKLIDDHERLGRAHVRNFLVLKIAIERIIDDVKPDRIISNDSFYGMWKMWEVLAKKKQIPFYSQWSATRVGRWAYAYNDAAMNLNFSKPWRSFSKIDLLDDDKQKVQEWLTGRLNGKDMVIDTASLAAFKNEDFDLTQMDVTKPTALLSANVVWDLAALNKEVFTSSMLEWIVETVKWFKRHPEYQLIVKPHPAEFYPGIPETKETVESMIKQHFTEIPNNIFILSPKTSISVYDFFQMSNVGLVFTSSVGMEMAARGIPVITAGKSHYRNYGFTLDPSSKKEYFNMLENTLKEEWTVNQDKMVDLAMKFIKFNFFHFFIRIGLLEFRYGEDKQKGVSITINHVEQLKEGCCNKYFDYILCCVANGDPVLTENKWMEES